MPASVVNRIRAGVEDLLKDRKLVVRILTVLLILAAALLLRIHESGKADITVDVADDASPASEIFVDIGGAVSRPGVYKADTTTRLYEVIEMAGGLRSDADTDSINQAAYVEDGQKIIIPAHREPSGDTYGESQPAAEVPAQAGAAAAASQDLVNINTASKEELQTLSGIGEVMADRIIEYRSGTLFKSIEDIKSVKGIGDAIFDKIKDSITV